VHPGVYVPRWHTEALARRAAELRPRVAVDLCTGCGAIARVLMQAGARVVASDLDPRAVENARANGVEAYAGDLYDPLPDVHPDLVVAVAPYVPTPELGLLQRDTLAFESLISYDGGDDGLGIVRRIIAEAPSGATLLLELGGDQAERLGLTELVLDEEGDVRGAVLRGSA
jgi:release factor glutamine methyltransferase